MLNSSSYQNEFTLRTLLKNIEVLESLTVASILAVVLFNPLMTFFLRYLLQVVFFAALSHEGHGEEVAGAIIY